MDAQLGYKRDNVFRNHRKLKEKHIVICEDLTRPNQQSQILFKFFPYQTILDRLRIRPY